MKFTAYDANKLRETRPYKRHYELLKAFDASGLDCAKVENFHHKHAYSCSSSLKKAIVRYKMVAIDAIARKDEVFLIRKSKFNFSQ